MQVPGNSIGGFSRFFPESRKSARKGAEMQKMESGDCIFRKPGYLIPRNVEERKIW